MVGLFYAFRIDSVDTVLRLLVVFPQRGSVLFWHFGDRMLSTVAKFALCESAIEVERAILSLLDELGFNDAPGGFVSLWLFLLQKISQHMTIIINLA
jgi:hypothetical protein